MILGISFPYPMWHLTLLSCGNLGAKGVCCSLVCILSLCGVYCNLRIIKSCIMNAWEGFFFFWNKFVIIIEQQYIPERDILIGVHFKFCTRLCFNVEIFDRLWDAKLFFYSLLFHFLPELQNTLFWSILVLSDPVYHMTIVTVGRWHKLIDYLHLFTILLSWGRQIEWPLHLLEAHLLPSGEYVLIYLWGPVWQAGLYHRPSG